MIVPDIIRYRKLEKNEFLENWLTAVARELVFSSSIPEGLLSLILVLKSLMRFLLIFLIFHNDSQISFGTLAASVCRDNYSSFCLLASSMTAKVYFVWILFSPALVSLLVLSFWGYLASSLLAARQNPNLHRSVGPLRRTLAFSAQVFARISLLFGVLGFCMAWIFVFTHSFPSVSSGVPQGLGAAGWWLGIVVAISSLLTNLLFSNLGFSWRRFHLPISQKLMGDSDILEYISDGLLLFGSNFSFTSRVALGIFSALVLCLQCCRIKSEFPVTWKKNPRLDFFNLGLTLVETVFLGYLILLALTDAQFNLPDPLLASVLFIVLSPLMSRFFANLFPFMAKKDHRILERIWDSMVTPEDLKSLMLLSKLLAGLHPGNIATRHFQGYRAIDLLVSSYIHLHTRECHTACCPCRLKRRGKKRSFRDSEYMLREVVAERLRYFIGEWSGHAIPKSEVEVFIAFLDFVSASHEAIIFIDFLHNFDSDSVQRVRWKLAFYASKLHRDQKVSVSDFPQAQTRLGLPEILQREYQLKSIRKLIRAYVREFLRLQRLVSDLKVELGAAKNSLGRLYTIELGYLRLFDRFKVNQEAQILDFQFRTYFRFPQRTSQGQGITALLSRMSDIQGMSRLTVERESDFQFLLLGVENQSSLYIIKASENIEGTLGFDGQLLTRHSIDFLIPERLRKAHSHVVEEFLRTGDPQLMTHAPPAFISNSQSDILPVTLSTQVILDWLGAKLLIFAQLQSTNHPKATIICDGFGTSLHVTQRLGEALGWPALLHKFELPFYLFIEHGAERFIDFVTAKDAESRSEPQAEQRLRKSLANFSDKLIVDRSLVAKMERMLRRQSLAEVEGTPAAEDVVEKVLAFKFKFIRDDSEKLYSYPMRFNFKISRLGSTRFVFINLLEEFAIENKVVYMNRPNLFFRMVLLRMFLRLRTKRITPQRFSAIKNLFTSLFAKRHSALQARRPASASTSPELPDRSGETARIASKFHGFNEYEPRFLKLLRLGVACLGCAFLAISVFGVLKFRTESLFIADKVTINYEAAYMITPLQYLNGAKLAQICLTTNCTAAGQAIQKAAVDWAKGRSKGLGSGSVLFARRDYLDSPTSLNARTNSANASFYSLVTDTFTGVMYKNTSGVNITDLIYQKVQTMWTNFATRFTYPGLEELLILTMDNFTSNSMVLLGVGLVVATLLSAGYLLLQRKLNFIIGMVQFFDHQHFSERTLINFATSTSLTDLNSGLNSSKDSQPSFSELRQLHKASLWHLFPLVRVSMTLGLLFFVIIWAPYTVINGLHKQILAAFVMRTVVSRSILSNTIKGHELLYPASVVRIPDSSWSKAINNLTQIVYYGEEEYPIKNRTKLIGILSTACQSNVAKNFPDCSRYFDGVLTQGFLTINPFFINHKQRQSGNFSLTSPQTLDLAIVLTISGIYLRDLTAAIQTIGGEQLGGLSSNVLQVFWIVFGVGAILVLSVYFFILRPMHRDVKASLRIIHFLDPVRAFSNSQIRFFVDKLS